MQLCDPGFVQLSRSIQYNVKLLAVVNCGSGTIIRLFPRRYNFQLYCGMKGRPMLSTTQRGRLPKYIPTQYLHKEATKAGDPAAKVARFLEPITAVKTYQGVNGSGKPYKYTRVHCSFQSTSS